MNGVMWQRVREVFGQVVDCEPEKRGTRLDELCPHDDDLRREVNSLLAAHRDARDFLDEETPVDRQRPEGASDGGGPGSLGGREIGNYRVLRLLARGGMGAVYLAQRADDEFHKTVALKLLNPEIASLAAADVRQRFRIERQILAALEHPNIARFLDGGTTEDGAPYFVMEFVDGEPIDEYCDRAGLSLARRLQLFLKVCQAVQFAHQNLVVHRDLKPANILVTHDGIPKLLDFGIAKLLNPELSGQSRVSTSNLFRPLTPKYASPEQLKGERITTASDVYSLGILLYKLLAGRHPYLDKIHSPASIVQVICEEEPLKPSVTVLDSSAPTGRRAAASGLPEAPSKLARRLQGDLDTIVLKALRKEPPRRYPSVEQLAADVHRYLADEPVMARRGSWMYRGHKFLRRHRIGVAMAALVLVMGGGFAAVMASHQMELARERDLAREERHRAQRVTQAMVDLFEILDPYKNPDAPIDVRQVLDQGTRKIRSQLADDPQVQSTLLETVGLISHNLGLLAEAERHLSSALEIRRHHQGRRSPEVAESLLQLATLYRDQGKFDRAGELLVEALELRRTLFGEESAEVAETLDALGLGLLAQGQPAAAAANHQKALHIWERVPDHDPVKVAQTLSNLAASELQQGKLEEAEVHFQRALDLYDFHLGPEHPRVATMLNNLGTVRFKRNDLTGAHEYFARAVALSEESLGEHLDVARNLHNLALVLGKLGDLKGAEENYRKALDLRLRFFGAQHWEVAQTQAALASLLDRQGKFEEGARAARAAVVTLRQELDPGDWRTASVESILGSCLTGLGEYEEAEELLLSSYRVLQQERGDEATHTQKARQRLARLYDLSGRRQEARRLADQEIEHAQASGS